MGLLERATKPTQGAAELSPEKKQMIDRAFKVGKNIIYGEKTKHVFGAIVKEVDSKEPAEALAGAIVMLLGTIEQDVGPMPMDVAMMVGLSLLGDLVDALNETGRGPFGNEVVSAAVDRGVQLWLLKNRSRIDPQELQSQMQQLQSFLGGQPANQPTTQTEGMTDGRAVV